MTLDGRVGPLTHRMFPPVACKTLQGGGRKSPRLCWTNSSKLVRSLRGALKKEIWVLRAPLFWVIVWSYHLFFTQKNKIK